MPLICSDENKVHVVRTVEHGAERSYWTVSEDDGVNRGSARRGGD